MYLSLHVCKKLKLVHDKFPFLNVDEPVRNPVGIHTSDMNTIEASVEVDEACDEVVLPKRPATLPLPATEENIPVLEKWLLDAFKDFCFDIDREPLPAMKTKSQHYHLKKDYQPYAATKPIPVAHHFKGIVEEELKADVRKGILKKYLLESDRNGVCKCS